MHVGQAMTREEMIDEAVWHSVNLRVWFEAFHGRCAAPPIGRKTIYKIRHHFTRIAAREAKT